MHFSSQIYLYCLKETEKEEGGNWGGVSWGHLSSGKLTENLQSVGESEEVHVTSRRLLSSVYDQNRTVLWLKILTF